MARRFKRWLTALGVVLGLGLPGMVVAEVAGVTPSVSVDLSYSDNSRLSGDGGGDFILSVRPRLLVEHRSARLNARVDYAIDALARSDGSGSRSVNSLDASGSFEAVEQFLFIDARASVSGENFSVFAPLALDNLTNSNNRGEVRSFGLSPYLRGTLGRDIVYSLRLDWSTLDADRENFQRSSNTRWIGAVNGGFGGSRFSWALSADASINHYPDREDLKSRIARARLNYTPLQQATVFATLGREHYNYSSGEDTRSVRGGGFVIDVGPRTRISAERERRFFGHSAAARISHRLPLVAGSLEYSRDLSSSNQQVFAAGQGNLVATLFDLYASRIPDPLERLTAVLDFMGRTGLPLFLTRPFAFFTQQPFVEQRLQGTLAWTGARNTVGLSGYRAKRQAQASGFSLIDDFAFGRQIDTRGAALDWRHSLSPLATLNFTLTQTRARAVDGTANTRNRAALAGLQVPLTGKSNAFFSLRHNRGDGTSEYRENAALAGLRITF